jgi:hypothetical protein
MTTTLKLYEAVDQLATVRGWVEEHLEEILAAGGELPPELAALLDEAEGAFAEKVERVALYVRELQATAEAVKAEAERLGARVRAMTRTADGLKGYLQAQLERAGRDKVAGTLTTVRLALNSVPTVTVAPDLDLATLPEELVEVPPPPSVSLNRKALQNWIAEGRILPDGITVERRKHLRIQ